MGQMQPVMSQRPQSDYAFSDADFSAIAKRAYKEFGLHLPDTKKDLVYSRLIKRLRHLGLADFSSYCALLESPDGAAEQTELLSALTTNVTNFFREAHHFKTLHETVLPPLLQAARTGKRVRLWSAGCSAGQEPYSIAFTILDLLPDVAKFNVRILATDIDPEILKKAERGIYPNGELKAIPEPARSKYLDHDKSNNGNFSISQKARDLVRFGELNLMREWPMRGSFDVIFCRNVAIYFDKQTQARLWHRFNTTLADGGYLFIGHSERVAGPAESSLQTVGITTYQKTVRAIGHGNDKIERSAE
jgi:chemotaxis protein methyltransferase CheR